MGGGREGNGGSGYSILSKPGWSMLPFLNKTEQNVHFPFSLGFYVTLYFPSKRAISSQVGTGHLVQSNIMAEPSLRSLDPGSFADEPPPGALWSLTREEALYNPASFACWLKHV